MREPNCVGFILFADFRGTTEKRVRERNLSALTKKNKHILQWERDKDKKWEQVLNQTY